MIEIVGIRGFIGSKMPVAPWADRKTVLYLRWHGTDKAGRDDEALQLKSEMELLEYVDTLRYRGITRFVGVGSWIERVSASPYGHHKARARKQSASLCYQLGDISHAWAQLFTVYGPGDKEENLIPTVVRKLLAGEEVRLDSCQKPWNFLYVSDAVQGLLGFARGGSEGVWQVVGHPNVTVRDVVEACREACGAPKDAVVYENEELLPGIAPYIQNAYVLPNTIPLRDGIERTVSWIREH